MSRVVLHRRSVWLHTTENWIYNQVRYCEGEFEQQVACLEIQNADRYHVPTIHRFPETSLLGRLRRTGLPGLRGRLTELPWLWRCLKKVRPVVVHSHFGDSGYDAAGMLAKMGIKHVVTFYGYDVNRLPLVFPEWKQRYRALFRLADRFLCEGKHMAACLVELGCPQEKVTVQHLGVDVQKIEFLPRRWTPGGTLRVLIAASFREKKGIPFALQALAKVRPQFPVELTIIGDASSHPKDQREKAKIMAALGETGLQNCTRLLGYQSHEVLWREALAHHLFLQPSLTASDGDTEGGAPVTLVEMLASGIPVVSTRHCDIPGIVVDGETGWLADERNAEQLAQNILRLVRHPETWGGMLQKGRQHVETNFNCIIQGRKLAQIYSGVLDSQAV